MTRHPGTFIFACAVALGGAACASDDPTPITGTDPDTAQVVGVDRFQDGFATLFKRSGPAFDPDNVAPIVPAPNAPIDMDTYFLVKALGPAGQKVTYYALDILPDVPARAYVFVDAAGAPVPGQLPVIDAIPGDGGYNDFVRISEVTVGDDFVANTLTSAAQVSAAVSAGAATLVETTRVANWAIVPEGTIATRKFAGARVDGFRAWYRDQVAHYLRFDEQLEAAGGAVPSSGIVVIFANDMSPGNGFEAEAGGQTHNVVETLPGDPFYSSYWAHAVGSRAGFDGVTDWASALANAAMPVPVVVNCPIVAP